MKKINNRPNKKTPIILAFFNDRNTNLYYVPTHIIFWNHPVQFEEAPSQKMFIHSTAEIKTATSQNV